MRTRSVRSRALAMAGALVAAALVIAGCAAERPAIPEGPPQVDAALPEATQTALESAVADAMVASGSSGAIVGVWAPWSGRWVAGVGTQSPTDKAPVSADMTFRIGDATRAMTCDVLFLVASEGVVRLGDSVTTYVPGVPDLKDVTLRQLCDGTSGIGSYQARLEPMWIGNPARSWDPRELASFGLGQARTTQPGVAWRDSDAGYLLLGLALQKATGKDAATLLSEYVFGPLGLASTVLPERTADWTDGRKTLDGTLSLKGADGVLNCAEPVDVTAVSTSTGFTDSGVVSTIADLGRYIQALAAESVVPADADRFANPLPVSKTSWFTAGGGAFQAGSLVGQYGSVPGYATAAYADPKTGMTVAVVLNNTAGGATFANDLAWELAAIASKAPAASGQTAPEFGLPWTAEQYHEAIATAAVCKPAAQ